jgi:hypothetical protein
MKDDRNDILPNLEEAIDLTSFGVDVNIQISRSCGQAWNRLYVRSQGIAVER